MNKIGIETYTLFCKYDEGSELERYRSRPKDVTEKIDNDISLLYEISCNFTMIQTGQYSKEMVEIMENENNKLRQSVTDDVFRLLERKENIYSKKPSFWQKLLGKGLR